MTTKCVTMTPADNTICITTAMVALTSKWNLFVLVFPAAVFQTPDHVTRGQKCSGPREVIYDREHLERKGCPEFIDCFETLT